MAQDRFSRGGPLPRYPPPSLCAWRHDCPRNRVRYTLRKKRLGPDRARALFVARSTAPRQLDVALHEFDRNRITVARGADVARVQLKAAPTQKPVPAIFSATSPALQIGEEIGLFSYAHGTGLLRRGKQLSRFGPIFQRGYISALSPFEAEAVEPDEVLLDLVTGPAASGGPVFRIGAAGEVIGILQASHESRSPTTSIAIPIVQKGSAIAVAGRHQVRLRQPGENAR